MNYHQIQGHERPAEDDDKDGPIVFCTKTCYNRWFSHKKKVMKAIEKAAKEANKKKRKVAWESDGSLDVLMDWLTTEGNYANYCGANGNKGKSKTQCQKELSLLMQQKIPRCKRNDKDVCNKIGSIKRQFREASDWANNTGQGMEVTGEQFEDAVKKQCPLYYQLEDIMGDRPNAQPLATNEDDIDNFNCNFSDDGSDGNSKSGDNNNTLSNATALKTSLNTPGNTQRHGSISSTASSSKRVSSTSARKRKSTTEADDLLSDMFGTKDFASLREREVKAREQEANAREQEATARMMEAQATSARANKETELLGVNKRVKCMDETVKLLRERKRLLDDKVCMEDELDKCLPLPK